MKRFCLAVLLSTVCAGLAHASAGLIDTLQSTGKFNTYIQLHNAAGMEAFPPTQAQRTFLVPTDAAFAKLPAGTLEALANDPQQLRAFLHAHAIDGIVDVGAMIGPTPTSKARLLSVGGSGIEVGGSVQGGQPVVRLKMLQAEGIVAETGIAGDKGLVAMLGEQAMGAVGQMGSVGEMGATGATDMMGAMAATGAASLMGAQAATGDAGAMGSMGAALGTQAMTAVVGETAMNGMGGMVAQQAMAAVVGTPATTPVATTKQSTKALLAQQGLAALFGRKKLDKQGLTNILASQAANGIIGEEGSQQIVGEKGSQAGLQAMLAGAALNQVQSPEALRLAGMAGMAGMTGATGMVGATGATGVSGLAPLRTLSLGARIGDPYNVLVAEGVMHSIDAVLTVNGSTPR